MSFPEEKLTITEEKQTSCHPAMTRENHDEPVVICCSEIEKPSISVIIPAYNAEKYLAETLESVLKSPASLYEIVVVNDGSTDATEAVMTHFAGANRQHFTIVTQPNRGQGAARNIAVDNAKGEYVLFLDSDDLLAEGALETLNRIAAKRDPDILHYNGRSFFENRELKEKNSFYLTAYQYYAELPDVMTGTEMYCRMKEDRGYYVSPCLAIYRRSYLLDHSIRFLEGVYHEDNLFMTQSLLLAERAAHIPDQLLLRRIHSESVMTQRKEFRHFHGYLQTVLREREVLDHIPFDQRLYRHVAVDIRGVSRMMYETYLQLADKHEALTRLDPVEYFFARLLLDGEKSRSQQAKTEKSASPSVDAPGRNDDRVPIPDEKKRGIKSVLHRLLDRFTRCR